MAVHLYVDHDLCVSSGACVLELPEAFGYQPGPEQLAIVLPGAEQFTEVDVRDAVELCPVEAIRLLDDDGNDVTAKG